LKRETLAIDRIVGDNMTRKITITISLSFIAIIAIIAVVVWYNNATAQPPWEPGPRVPFPSPETSAICATSDYVYVLSGDTLYQFSAADLKLIRKAPIEKEPRFRPGKPDTMEDRFPPPRKTPETE